MAAGTGGFATTGGFDGGKGLSAPFTKLEGFRGGGGGVEFGPGDPPRPGGLVSVGLGLETGDTLGPLASDGANGLG